MNEKLSEIAKRILDLPTLETRNNDHMDFREQAVWSIKQALTEAYKAGGKDGWEQAVVDTTGTATL